MLFSAFKKKSLENLHTVAFYNLENLFDTLEDPNTLDDDFTPKGFKNWSKKRYARKLNKLGSTIAKLGLKTSNKGPALLGVVEVENKTVLRDLLGTKALQNENFQFVHYDSPDERGIDTALIYKKENFEVIHSQPINLLVYNLDGARDGTRDILYVHGKLNGEEVHVFVNHWPSRRDGDTETAYKRLEAVRVLIGQMNKIEKERKNPNYIIMGDFNDGPADESIRQLVATKELYNPMEKLVRPDRGSANYRRTWALFDQILVSHSFFNYEKGSHSFAHANIFDRYFLKEWQGKYRGNPFRTYAGRKYLGGFSDHFPVYIQLKYHE